MKKILSIILSVIFILSSFSSVVFAAGFEDCKKSDWYYESVMYAKEKGWVNGFEDGTFRPNDTLTKAQAVSIVARAIGLEIPSTTGKWYDGAVKIGKEKGLIFTDLFLEDAISREEVFYMFYKGYDFESINETVRDDITPFEDYVYNVFSKSIPTFYSFGILNGYSENGKMLIKPKGKLTRAEMCTILKSVSEFDFEDWKKEKDFFSDSVVKEHLVKMIEENNSTCVMYAYGKSDTEVITRLRSVVKLCFDEYETEYPEYFKNYKTACGSLSSYNDCIKVTFKMTKK